MVIMILGKRRSGSQRPGKRYVSVLKIEVWCAWRFWKGNSELIRVLMKKLLDIE